MEPGGDELAIVIRDLADGGEIDWTKLEALPTDSHRRELVAQLRVIAGISRVCDCPAGERDQGNELAAPTQPIGRWGRLELRRELAHGGFGRVYSAWDPQLQREVALKLPRFERRGAVPSDILREARRLARIRHPNIVQVYGVGLIESQLGLWMELIRGHTLEYLLEQQGPFEAREAALTGTHVCRALAAVHAAGLVHRDVKAQNVMREHGGRIVLMDLGLSDEVEPAWTSRSSGIRGTPFYMAPELLEGRAATVQSDFYAVGVLLYHLVTASYPVTGHDAGQILEAHRGGRVRLLRDSRPDLPETFVGVVERALAIDPGARFETAGKMERALAGCIAPAEPAGAERPGRSRRAIVAALSGSTLLLAALFLLQPSDKQGRASIAVLPFANLSSDRNTDYFSDGITEELISALTKIPDLRVVARNSAFRFKGRPYELREIRRELRVHSLLTGSVRVSGTRLRISAQLVNADDGYQLWSESYEREAKDLFAIQEDIARTIATTLQLRLGRFPVIASGARTSNLEAHDLYLRGRYHWNLRSPEELRKGLAFFERAIAEDPNYALAYSGIADTYSTLVDYGDLPAAEGIGKAKRAALEALRIDNGLAEAHASLAWLSALYDWDWPAAERGFRRAIELNPGYAAAHYWYAALLCYLRRFQESIAQVRRARELDPLSPSVNANVGWMLLYARHYGLATDEAKRALALDPNFIYAHHLLAEAYARTGRSQEALEECHRGSELSGNHPLSIGTLGLVYAVLGQREQAARILDLLNAKRVSGSVPASYLAAVYSALGQKDEAFRWLDTAYQERDRMLLWINASPAYDGLRDDPRYATLLRKLRLSAG